MRSVPDGKVVPGLIGVSFCSPEARINSIKAASEPGVTAIDGKGVSKTGAKFASGGIGVADGVGVTVGMGVRV